MCKQLILMIFIISSFSVFSSSLPNKYFQLGYGVLKSDGEFTDDMSLGSMGYAHQILKSQKEWGVFYLSYKINVLMFDLENAVENAGIVRSNSKDIDIPGFSYGAEVNILKYTQIKNNLSWLIGIGFGISIPHLEKETGKLADGTEYSLQFNKDYELTTNFKVGAKYQFHPKFSIMPSFDLRKAFGHLEVQDRASSNSYKYDNYLAGGFTVSVTYDWN